MCEIFNISRKYLHMYLTCNKIVFFGFNCPNKAGIYNCIHFWGCLLLCDMIFGYYRLDLELFDNL